jgi:hypothetical protein
VRSRLIYYLLLLLFFSLCNCSADDPIPDLPDEPELPGENGKPDEPDEEGLIILDPSDVQDYEMIYKPKEFVAMNWLREDSRWSLVRSRQSEHFILFWEEGFGDDPGSSSLPEALRVDVDDLLTKAETFFTINVEQLKFAERNSGTSNLERYKMQIYLHYQTEWLATGAGYDDVIGALWVNPSTCKPVGSTIAHEIGHSFQYQVYADLLAAGETANDYSRGFRYGFGGDGGNGFWEQTAQWQSFQSYPAEAFESYNFDVYTENAHRHICHEWQRYASYFIHYYWSDRHGVDFIGKLWREAVRPEDPVEAYMRMNELSVEQMNDEMYEAAARFVTWDLEEIRTRGSSYTGKQSWQLYPHAEGGYQVAYSHCPGTTGYNAIPLNIPAEGTTITVTFDGLTPGSPLASADPGLALKGEQRLTVESYNTSDASAAGWRYGFVALITGGERIYGEMQNDRNGTASFVVPANCERVWFVVSGAPTRYQSHAWDEDELNDEQWPYRLQFTGTDLLGNIAIDPDAVPEDITLTYNLSFPADAAAYSGAKVDLISNSDLIKVAEAFKMQGSAISGMMLEAKETAREGKIAFAAVEPGSGLNYNTTANGYGFWFDSQGRVIGWGNDNDSKLFAEFTTLAFQFSIGQYPGKCKAGDSYTIREALVYTKEGKQYRATFVFNISITQ